LKNGFADLISERVRGIVLRDESLASHTSLRVGGPADWFISPADLEDLQTVLGLLADYGMPYLVIGGGYNLLVRDGGFRGAIISLERFDRLEPTKDCLLHAAAGVANRSLVDFALERECSGLEFLVGIPGRLGGVLAMNAGAGGEAITDHLETLVTLKNGIVTFSEKGRLDYGYRYLRLAPGEIILEAVFRLKKVRREEIGRRLEEFLVHRRAAQQVGYPNAGSFFRNPSSGPAWRFIEAAGLRGCRVGGAQVSEVHANFLVNRGGATAADFLSLAARIKEKVRKESGVELEEEVRIVGEG
jgi:UDP-N-acetylmuramate dehydrogenase